MELIRVKIDGIKNLNGCDLELNNLNALVALNNYGKSNFLQAVDFGIHFLKAQPDEKRGLMTVKNLIPINQHLAERDFWFEIEFASGEYTGIYNYSFSWPKKSKPAGIVSESLKLKKVDENKLSTYISRDKGKNSYKSSDTGRCSTPVIIGDHELIINKLNNFDNLFYIPVIKELNNLQIYINEMLDLENIFRFAPDERVDYEKDELKLVGSHNVSKFIFFLKERKPDQFELLVDSLKSLIPKIEELDPLEIDLTVERKQNNNSVPFELPQKIYDIIINEKNNNQPTTINSVSSGTKRILLLLTHLISANMNKIPLIAFEEPENSIHPGLLQRLLMVIDSLTDTTKILITSHSPYLIKYLDLDNVILGMPDDQNTAIFKRIKPGKHAKLQKHASSENQSTGDFIFDLLIEGDNEYLQEFV